MLRAPANFSYRRALQDTEFRADPRVIYADPITVFQARELLEQKAFSSVSDGGLRLQHFVGESLSRMAGARDLSDGGGLSGDQAGTSSAAFSEIGVFYHDMVSYLEDMQARAQMAEGHAGAAGSVGAGGYAAAQGLPELPSSEWEQAPLAVIPPGLLEITSIVNSGLSLAPGEKPREFMDRYFPEFLGSIRSVEERKLFCDKLGEFLSKLERVRTGAR